ncbi:hypothetical protein CcrC1_gp441 [Caulobacter phage C1]|nr:hypothetical protein CcrC1_gp441 [Caulobacter phage C1]UTU08670.1 hypothetical protein CcrC2_gp442 [Caulobacter phage C2]UTU09748.1 hypothetical protein CcrBL47_gp464 [Caulobacter phage BL47]UTU10302.1 hypothetical protein CcrRB23_gp440 [Caulobacter phage RB23]WGN97336.1 hypothetical protein [Bertelyvirus sp.]
MIQAWPQGYSFERDELLALVKTLDQYDAATRSNFLGLVAEEARGGRVALLSKVWPPQHRQFWLSMTGVQERLFIRCFEHIRYGEAPLKITDEGVKLLHLFAEFYPDEIADHIGPHAAKWTHLRPPPKEKPAKKPKKDASCSAG